MFWGTVSKSNQIFIILSCYAGACYEWRGPSPRLSVWATQLRRNVAAVASVGDTVSNLTDPGSEPQPSQTNSIVLTTELVNRPAGYSERQLIIVRQAIPCIALTLQTKELLSSAVSLDSKISFFI